MNILYISPIQIASEQGDSTHFLELGENLKQYGNNVLVICRGEKLIPQKSGINIKYMPNVNIKYLTTFATDCFIVLYLFFYIVFFKPDVIYYRGGPFLG